MSERMTPGAIEFDKKQTADVRKIGEYALRISEQNYCSGYPDFRGGEIRKLLYHNARHNRTVGDYAIRMAMKVELSSSEGELAKASGYAHDIVQLGGRGKDERESAEWIEGQLLEKGLPKEVAVSAYKAIWGTLPIFENGLLIDQTANRQEYDSKRDELLAKSVASADLGHLFTPEGLYLSHLLYAQIQGALPGETPDLANLEAFAKGHVEFISSYAYPLKEAEAVLATHKKQVMRFAGHIADKLESGDIASWDELLERDRAFMNNPDMELLWI